MAHEWRPFDSLVERSQRADLAYRELLIEYPIHHEIDSVAQDARMRFVRDVLTKIPQRRERQKVMLGVGMIDHIED